MDVIQLIQKLIPQKQGITPGNILRPGQIINGQILKLFPNQMAEVQVGSQKMIAKLEIPLIAGERYWFQVQTGEGQIHLKMITQLEKGNSEEGLLKQLGISPTNENLELLNFVLTEKIPIEKDTFHQASLLLKEFSQETQGLTIIKNLLVKGLPFTKNVFQAELSLHENIPMHQLMKNVSDLLMNANQTGTSKDLQNLLTKEIGVLLKNRSENIEWSNGQQVSAEIQRMIKVIGFDYEHQLIQHGGAAKKENNSSLKPLLIRFLNEHPATEQKEAAEQLLNRITALQLSSYESGPVQQYVAQIPLLIGKNSSDLLIQWNGRRKQNGKIDPNYCRVHFYIDLENIGDTFIDMQIQNRIMNISIVNSRNDLKEIAFPLVSRLKRELSKMDYHLSAVKFLKPNETQRIKQANESFYSGNDYEGVDFRV